MTITLLAELVQNIALLLSLAFLYSLIRPYLERTRPRPRAVIPGLLFGIIGIIGMLTPIEVAAGVIVDGRVIVTMLAGVFNGIGAAVTAAAMVSAYRIWLGGVGTVPGVGSAFTAALLGAWVHMHSGSRMRDFKARHYLLLGTALAVLGALWAMALPDAHLMSGLLRLFALLVALAYPLGTLFLGTLLSHESRRHEAEEALRRAHNELERRVAERTAGLSRANELLERDITERKRAEEALATRTRQLEAVRAVSAEITRELDLTTLLGLITRRAEELLAVGTSVAWLWEEKGQVLVPAAWRGPGDWWGDVCLRLGEGVAGTVAQRREGMIVNDYRSSPYGIPVFLERSGITAVLAEPLLYRDQLLGVITVDNQKAGRPFTEEDRHLFGLFAAHAAIAVENARLFEQVRSGRERLQTLARRLVEVQESERRDIARELHDQVGQTLTALGINLNILRGHLPAEARAGAEARLADTLQLVDQTVESIRTLMAELRPPVLDDYGLLAALRWYGEQVTGRAGLPVEVRGQESVPRRPSAVETALFRIAQEALTNVVKHAQATRATVTVEEAADRVRLTIADDGAGFDPATLNQRGEPRRWGLLTMQERAEGVGGTLLVDAAPGKGTRVVVEVPR